MVAMSQKFKGVLSGSDDFDDLNEISEKAMKSEIFLNHSKLTVT